MTTTRMAVQYTEILTCADFRGL